MSETEAVPVQTRLLVVDDAGLVRMYYRGALERAGFAVDEALNGIEALERVLSTSYDLLVVDVNMPKMDGISFLRALRGRDLAIRSIPALMTSTEAGDGDRVGAGCRKGVAGRQPLEQPHAEPCLEPVHAAEHRGVIDAEPARSRR